MISYFLLKKKKIDGRKLGKNNHINRIWAYLDKSIESSTDKDIAKAHIDFLGNWMKQTNSKNCKGVHDEVNHIEAVQTVFHTYLVLSHILSYE